MDVMQAIKERRSVRKYRPDPVSRKDIDKLRKTKKFKLYEIGTITSGNNLMMIDRLGRKRKVELKGFEHF